MINVKDQKVNEVILEYNPLNKRNHDPHRWKQGRRRKLSEKQDIHTGLKLLPTHSSQTENKLLYTKQPSIHHPK